MADDGGGGGRREVSSVNGLQPTELHSATLESADTPLHCIHDVQICTFTTL